MVASELMVGNAVNYFSLEIMVTAIKPPYFVDLGTDGKTTVTNASIDFVSPIPITEEFLERNGFKCEYDCICEFNYYIREIDGYYIEIQLGCSNSGDEYVVCHIDNCDRNSVASADIRYVHQLQNLLNLLEIEWEVKV